MYLFRFAPSPTGYLHVGNARVALFNYLFAKSLGGQFMLRMDDTDLARNRPEYEAAIYEDLAWLGLDWDVFARQSDRMARYEMARQKLYEMGRLYPCFETEEELSLKRKTRLARGLPPIYDQAALKLSKAEIAAKIAAGEKPHWRFKLTGNPIEFEDLMRGSVHFGQGHLSDPVVIREDGRVLYSLSSVVDDGELAITHILRGEDHVTNTAVQVELFEALGFTVPQFIHFPLMLGADGEKLSKRIGGLSLRELRADGYEAMAINALLARLGTNLAPTGNETMQKLTDDFSIESFGRAAPRFDLEQLISVNQHHLANLAYGQVQNRLQAMQIDAPLWLLVQGNIQKLSDAALWQKICYGDIASHEFDEADRAFLKQAAHMLPAAQAWEDDGVYQQWTDAIKKATGRKGKALFMPLRLAMTGQDHGPAMPDLLRIIGREKIYQRLHL